MASSPTASQQEFLYGPELLPLEFPVSCLAGLAPLSGGASLV